MRQLVSAGVVTLLLISATGLAVGQAEAQSRKPAPPPTGKPMTGTDIQTFLVGVRIKSVAPDGTTVFVTHSADGKSVYEFPKGDRTTKIPGIWIVRGNQFCRKFERPKETEVCLDYRRVDDTTVAVYNEKKLVARQSRE